MYLRSPHIPNLTLFLNKTKKNIFQIYTFFVHLGFLDISIQKYTTVRTISDEVKRKSKGLKELKYSMCV